MFVLLTELPDDLPLLDKLLFLLLSRPPDQLLQLALKLLHRLQLPLLARLQLDQLPLQQLLLGYFGLTLLLARPVLPPSPINHFVLLVPLLRQRLLYIERVRRLFLR